jgi:hypothetical protein
MTTIKFIKMLILKNQDMKMKIFKILFKILIYMVNILFY